MNLLIDHNIEKHGKMLSKMLVEQGWSDFLSVKVVTFDDVNLAIESSDREVWRIAQKQNLILVTANRRMIGEDSLEQVLREENTAQSLPVITLANSDRFTKELTYRRRCLFGILDILMDMENLMGSERLFVP